MSKIVSFQTIKVCFAHYFIAFFMGRLLARFFGYGLQSLSLGSQEGASPANVAIYFFASVVLGFVVMALGAVWIFVHLKKLRFSMPLFAGTAVAFSLLGVAGVVGSMNALDTPQVGLAVILIQFVVGLVLAARYTEKPGVAVVQEKVWEAPGSWN